MNVLVYGASGKLGVPLCNRLRELGHAVRYGFDICNYDQMRRCYEKWDVDVVINCAALVGRAVCDKNPLLAFEVNALGALNILKVWADDTDVIHISTEAVRDSPPTVYSITKGIAEYYAEMIGATVLRFDHFVVEDELFDPTLPYIHLRDAVERIAVVAVAYTPDLVRLHETEDGMAEIDL